MMSRERSVNMTRYLPALLFVIAFPAHAEDRTPRWIGSGSPLRYLILGDSTAAGVGGDYEKGIAVGTAEGLARDGRRVELVNLSVSGARIHDVLTKQLPKAQGKFDLVLLDVGANDVIRLTPSSRFERDFEETVKQILTAHCSARVVVTGSPDMGAPPRIPRLLRPLAAFRTRRINVIANRMADRYDLTFAPIAAATGPLFRKDRSLFDADRFHPNDAGYATWIPVLNTALRKALEEPASRCK